MLIYIVNVRQTRTWSGASRLDNGWHPSVQGVTGSNLGVFTETLWV